LQLNPDFQRGHVWIENQQIKYIEYILRGGKTARVIYLNNLKTRKEVLQWYLEFNSYGTIHTEEEINKVKKLLEMEG